MGSRTWTRVATPALLALLTACASSDPAAVHAGHMPPPSPDADAVDSSADWHGLLIEPLGVLLHDVKVPVHEVLLFHDDTARVETDKEDCYAIGGEAPRFLGQQPASYLMCFEHDRLNRVEAAVQLSAAGASGTFSRACTRWLKGAEPVLAGSTTCEGHDGGVAFGARLSVPPGQAVATLSITLMPAAGIEGGVEPADGK